MQTILTILKKGYGYEIWRIYQKAYTPIKTSRIFYYHLKKGLGLGLWELKTQKDSLTKNRSWSNVTFRNEYEIMSPSVVSQHEEAKIKEIAMIVRRVLARQSNLEFGFRCFDELYELFANPPT